jgi:predicted CXXCH cytochrome family protein
MRKLSRYLIYPLIIIGLPLISSEFSRSSETQGKTCLDCHPELQKKISEEKAHTPARNGNCISCHNPHASNHKGLLKSGEGALCYKCHKDDKSGGFNQAIIHDPVRDGKCLICHNPHSSSNEKLLIKKDEEMCFTCHSKDSLMTGKESHPLVKKGECIICHTPHSSGNEGLIKKMGAELCLSCHKVKEKQFINAHSGYPVEGTNCSSCHNPHSSNTKSLLKASIHQPMAKKDCKTCHSNSNSKNPLKLINSGATLCYNCHINTKKSFEKINNHTIGNKGNSCLNCHNPHASDTKYLLDKREEKVCFKCHDDTKMRITSKSTLFKHPKLEDCSSCHNAHGSDNIFFLRANEGESCNIGKCHEQQQIFSHPIGSDTIDPRNKKEMNCVTCHNPMGTGYKNNLRLDPDKELCEQCHRF